MKIKIPVILLLIILILFSCKKNNKSDDDFNYKKENQIDELKKSQGFAVINENRIRFRSDNNLYSKTLRYLDSGEIVAVILKDEIRVKIDELEDYWYYIEFEGIKGWVFGYYLDVYTTYDNALIASKKYKEEKIQSSDNLFVEESIKYNLFFISDGKLVQNISGKKDGNRILKLEEDYYITNYFFSNNSNEIYYIGKKSLKDFNGNLFLFDLKKENSRLIKKDIHTADINLDKNIIVAIGNNKEKDENFWVIYLIYIDENHKLNEIAKIKQRKVISKKEGDYFSWTLEREFGSMVKLKLNEKVDFIYFKPPEVNLPYLISLHDGKYIQVNEDNENYYIIDSVRSLKVVLKEDELTGKAVYNIVLKDKYSGLEKELISSQLYPINMSVSLSKNLLVLSMIDMNIVNDEFYNSSIYVISLYSNALISVSGDGKSYQPRWVNSMIKAKNE